MNQSLNGKHIVLGITGSIAAYKAAILIRLLIKEGAEVQVVITPAGKEFITPITLSTLTSKPVISEFFSGRDGSWHSHVALGQWADAMVIAPCTASTLGKMANGIADNMLVTTYFAMKAPVFIAPAMDLDMYEHPVTQHNISALRDIGNIIIDSPSGELASKLVGNGRMQEPENIVAILKDFFLEKEVLSKKKILITAGPTFEHIDPVRFIGNHSTGKMGFALAEECASYGANVTLIAGPVSLKTVNPSINRIDVVSADQMYNAATAAFMNCDAAILCAAVADFKPANTSNEKIKRKGEITLKLTPTQDIAATLGSMKRNNQRMVGFALETNDELSHAREKLKRKNLDFIVLNSLKDEGAGFGYDTNKVSILDNDGCTDYPLQSKKSVASIIVRKLIGLLTMLAMLLLPSVKTYAQELNATITLNTSKISGTNKDIFKSLETALNDFLNNQIWTDYKFDQRERISCSFNITVNTYDVSTGQFSCELMVQSSRPVYNSSYFTTVFNYHDTDFDFTYREQDRLEFNNSNLDNNLTATMAFYSLLIIGLDFDSMSMNGGTEVLRQAENIAAGAQSLGAGWKSYASNTNRYILINDYMNGSLSSFRKLQYIYHRQGLDDMAANVDRGRAVITESMNLLSEAKQSKSNSSLPLLFTEIKKDELLNIYSKGLTKEKEKVVAILNDINPSLSTDWNTINSTR